MKKTLFLLIASFSMIFFGACHKDTAPQTPEGQAEQKPIQISAAVANSTTHFAFDFFKTLQTDPEVTGDIFVSPLSLHMALGMLVNGATRETKEEMMKALKSENLSQTELNESYKKLLNELPKADPKVKLGLANAIWYKNDFQVEQDFVNAMKSYFNAQVTGLPFAQSDVTTINKWASDNTNGKIDRVIDQFSDDLVMLLMNALYFKGDWTSQFETKNTRDQSFTLENGTTKTVRMMNQTDNFEYASMPDFDAVQLPYGNKQFRATLLLPKNGKTLPALFNGLTADSWNSLQNAFKNSKVILGVPKFTLRQEFQLNPTLKKMGMQRAFTEFAQLDGLNKTAPLLVSFVKQNTFAAVDEVGTEAAAVTTIGVGVTSVPVYPEFICNRPFAFIISEKTSNTILFMGRIMDPKTN